MLKWEQEPSYYLAMNTAMQTTTQAKYEAAMAAIKDGESRNLGRTAMARRYKALFAIEDMIKAGGGWS